MRLQTRRQLAEEWRKYLTSIPLTASGTRVVGAVGPVLEEWMDRPRGTKMSFHLIQVLSGHGCFREYLCKIGKESTKHCHHCEEEEDTAQHTLEHCPAWAEERRVLTNTIGEDFSLPTVVRQMVGSEDNWKAVSSFCSNVMRQKEEAGERESGRDGGDGEDMRLPLNPAKRETTLPRCPGEEEVLAEAENQGRAKPRPEEEDRGEARTDNRRGRRPLRNPRYPLRPGEEGRGGISTG